MNKLPGFTSAGEKAKREGSLSHVSVAKGYLQHLDSVHQFSFPCLPLAEYEKVSFLKQVAFLEAITHNSVCYN